MSSGTVGASHKDQNLGNHRLTLEILEDHGLRGFVKDGYGDQLTQARLDEADINVCLNQRVYEGCLQLVTFAVQPRVWSVADIGEPGRIPADKSEIRMYQEEAYREIIGNVDQLVAEVLRDTPRSRT